MITTTVDDTITLLELLELSNNKRLGRATDAAERAADALGRIATSLEKLTEQAASVIGSGYVDGNTGEAFATKPASYVRTGGGRRIFRDVPPDDEED